VAYSTSIKVYADEWLVIPAMHYRWSFPENLDFIYREFGRTNLPDASASAQVHAHAPPHTHHYHYHSH
jgi:hypothetical protein